MKSLFLKALPAILAGSALIAGARAFAADPATTQDVQQQLQALQAKVAQLEAQQQQSDQATVKSVLTDAEKRSQLMADSVDITSGYDKGFFIQSADKTFTFKPGIVLQLRNATTWREDAKNGGTSDDLQNGFEIRRFKLQASGNAYGPDVTYGLQLTNNRNTAAIEVDDIWVQYMFAPHYGLKAGQFKGPFNREELISDSAQLAVERSLLNDVLGGGLTGPRSQGVSFLGGFGGENYSKDAVHYEVMLNDGDGTPNTDWRDTSGTTPDTRADWGSIARIDYKAFGSWSDLGKFSAKNSKENLLVFGGAVSASGNPGANVYRFTGDVLYQGLNGKLDLYGAAIGSYSDIRTASATAEDSRLDYGGIVQVGYLVNPAWEPFARADMVWIDDDFVAAGAGGDNGFPEFTVGVNYYMGKDGAAFNKAKLTIDATYLPSGTPGDRTGANELASGGKNEIVVRAQLQFAL
jgi:phosphate-selective porin